jgi:nitronate monooxygenase
MQVWAGQSAAMAQAKPAAEIVREVWDGTRALLV